MQIFAWGCCNNCLVKKTLTFAAQNVVVVAVVIALDMPICDRVELSFHYSKTLRRSKRNNTNCDPDSSSGLIIKMLIAMPPWEIWLLSSIINNYRNYHPVWEATICIIQFYQSRTFLMAKNLYYARWNHHKSFEHRVTAPLTFWVPDIFQVWNQNLTIKYYKAKG